MTKQEKIVAIAKDVIAQINRRSGGYLVDGCSGYISSDFDEVTVGMDMQEIVPKLTRKKCGVCALGAALISKAKLFNNVPVDENMVYNSIIDVGQTITMKHLEDIFPKKMLKEMECAFENGGESYGAAYFGLQYKNPKKRLLAIMQNIIDNDGKFVFEKMTANQFAKAYSNGVV